LRWHPERALPHLPDVPTASEAGLPQFEISGWYALFAPKGTPAPIIGKLNAAMRAAVANPDYQKRLDDLGSMPAATPKWRRPISRPSCRRRSSVFERCLVTASDQSRMTHATV
jgi:hypothetical protein